MTKRRVLPLVWMAFSGGGVTAAMFLPVLAFLFALAFRSAGSPRRPATTCSTSCETR